MSPTHQYTMDTLHLTVNGHKTFTPDDKLSALGVKPFNYFDVSISNCRMDDAESMLNNYVEVNVTETREPILYQQIKKAVIDLIGNLNVKENIFMTGKIHGKICSTYYFTPEIVNDDHPHIEDELNTFLSKRGCLTNSIH